MWGRDSWAVGMDMYTLLYLKWINNKDLLFSTENSAQCYVPAWMGREKIDTCIHILLNPFAIHRKHHNIVNKLYFNTE